MFKKTILSVLGLFFLLFNLFAVYDVGETVDNFILLDYNNQPVNLTDFSNKNILLDFFFVDCSSCNEHLPEIWNLYLNNMNHDFIVIFVDILNESNDKIRQWAQANNITTPVLKNGLGVLNLFSTSSSVPYFALLDKQRILRFKGADTNQDFYTIFNYFVDIQNNSFSSNIKLSHFPNPFNPSTTITYELNNKEFINLSIYNVKGELIRTLVNENKEKGKYSIIWDGKDSYGKNMQSGIYFYKLKTNTNEISNKMLLLK